MFEIRFTPEAIDDLRTFSTPERKRIMEGIDACLRHEPHLETRNNKALRPNRLAERELRVNRFRVFYDIDEGAAWVKIEAIGHKRGSSLYVRGQEFQL
ncbi:MAG: type II toxin-antitoxin system RelE/ParE family toxin [Bryobacterales bacterium]|nr:type II toxin-antitoxin system RelE/ParE family toxin [Bryobacterales bacterium]